ncbi:MAG TPA: CsgG/HfaB family protein [Vicinamibacteria bacterium]|jgi:curli biogenesis system outer membrane secretion channel CsgG
MRAVATLITLTMLAAEARADLRGATQAPRRTVAVASFQLPPDFMADPAAAGLGPGLAAMMTTALVASERFVVVERPEPAPAAFGGPGVILEAPAPPAAGEGTAAHQLVIVGTVTEFSQAVSESGFSIGLGLGGAKLGLAPQTTVGKVAFDLRAVDAASGQVVAAFSVRESFKTKGATTTVTHGEASVGRTDQRRTPVGEAARRAVEAAVRRLSEELASREWAGRVVDVADDVAINAGAAAGIRAGDRFRVYRTSKVLTDPETGQVLGQRRRAIGSLTITSVEPNLAFGAFVAEGGAVPERGDAAVFTGSEPAADRVSAR